MPCRSKNDPADRKKGGRSPVGRIFIFGAVELSEEGQPRRIRLAQIPDGASKTLRGFIANAVTPGATVITDGWLGYESPPANPHEVHVVEGRKAHEVLKWVHRVFRPGLRLFGSRSFHWKDRRASRGSILTLKTWARGVCPGLRKAHVQRYLDEFEPFGAEFDSTDRFCRI